MSKKSNRQRKKERQRSRKLAREREKDNQPNFDFETQEKKETEPIKKEEKIDLKTKKRNTAKEKKRHMKAYKKMREKPLTIDDYYKCCSYPKPTFEIIQSFLKDKRLSYISEKTGISFPTLRKILKGDRNVAVEKLLIINRYIYQSDK